MPFRFPYASRVVDGDGVKLSDLGIYRVSAGSNSDDPNEQAHLFCDPPTVRNWLGKVMLPTFDKLQCYRPVCLRHQLSKAGIPRIDVYSSYDGGGGRCRRSDLGVKPRPAIHTCRPLSLPGIVAAPLADILDAAFVERRVRVQSAHSRL